MAEVLRSNLSNYKQQLDQVEAALTTSPDNEELLKLKQDLDEVIELTNELIRSQQTDDAEEEILNTRLGSSISGLVTKPFKRNWKVGDRCLALSDDGEYLEATIETIEDDEISVLLLKTKEVVVSAIELLKELPRSHNAPAPKIKRPPPSKAREYQKSKKIKKQARFKQMEEERELEKNKWLSFNSKTYKKGIIKKSIFATPDNVNGRVGIGTCGVGGKEMTHYTQAEKYCKKAGNNN